MSPEAREARRRSAGGLMFAVGLLMALLSGTCTLAFWVPDLPNLLSGRDAEGVAFLPFGIVLGGVPFGCGVVLMFAGLSRMRRRRTRAEVFGPRPPPPGA